MSRQRRQNGEGRQGFTLLELMVVVGLIAVASATAVVTMPSFARTMKADAEMQRLVSAVRQAREAAITQRRNVLLEFPSSGTLRSVRQDIAGGVVSGTTVLETITFESGFEYRLLTGLPDTPDGFGRDSPQSFGSATSVRFTTEGALVDQTGDPVNGTLSIGLEGEPLTARAVTVLGSTGLVTGYRWDGRNWTK